MTSELGDITLPDTDFDRLAQEIIDDKRIEDAKKSIQNGDSFFSHDVEALIETFEKQFDQLKSEVDKKDAEIKRLIALDMERMRWADDELAKKDARIRELESEKAHTCYDLCPKIECVQRRRIDKLEEALEKIVGEIDSPQMEPLEKPKDYHIRCAEFRRKFDRETARSALGEKKNKCSVTGSVRIKGKCWHCDQRQGAGVFLCYDHLDEENAELRRQRNAWILKAHPLRGEFIIKAHDEAIVKMREGSGEEG